MKVEENQNAPPSKRPYSRISLKKKANLIKLVFRKSMTINEAIALLGLKKTTAVNIINNYKEQGSVPMRKYRREQPLDEKDQDILKKEENYQTQQFEEYSAKNNANERRPFENRLNQVSQAMKQEPDDPADYYHFY